MSRVNSCLQLLIATVLLLNAGCGGGAGLPAGETGTVSGTVTLNGQPIQANCAVTFLPPGDAAGVMAIGTTDAAGMYALKMRDQEGVLVGKYHVSVSPPRAPVMDVMAEDAGDIDDPPPLFPQKYLSPETSGVTLDVVAGSNKLDIKMVN